MSDGLNLLEHKWTPESVQLTVSASPTLAPIDIARLLKGRLQHRLRKNASPVDFSRKVSLRGIGHNTRSIVDGYIHNQLAHADLADERYRTSLQNQSFTNPAVCLADPFETNSGCYWYNPHVVLVTSDRWRMDGATAEKIGVACRKMDSHMQTAKLSIMPDHMHIAVKADPSFSPSQVAIRLQEVTARAVGMLGLWKDTFYVGTFGEYSMAAVRNRN